MSEFSSAPPSKVLGILGGGQLAMMLADAAKLMNIRVVAYTSSREDPVCSSVDEFILGELNDVKCLSRFFSIVDQCVFENEWLDAQLIERLALENNVLLTPKPNAMASCADKLEQKQLLEQLEIPSSEYVSLLASSREPSKAWLDRLRRHFRDGLVLKWAKGGYDGKGTYFVSSSEAIAEDCLEFIDAARALGVNVYAEKKVDFQAELALVSFYSASGRYDCFPLVKTLQEDGICVQVRSFAADKQLKEQARSYAETLARALDLIGVFAIEFFLTKEGKLLVNELAPRVHNSGHVSQDACSLSQFQAHIYSCLDLPTPTLDCQPYFAMINILGPASYQGELFAPEVSIGQLHWYKKKYSKPLRKLGHVNLLALSQDELDVSIEKVKDELKAWQDTIHSNQTKELGR